MPETETEHETGTEDDDLDIVEVEGYEMRAVGGRSGPTQRGILPEGRARLNKQTVRLSPHESELLEGDRVKWRHNEEQDVWAIELDVDEGEGIKVREKNGIVNVVYSSGVDLPQGEASVEPVEVDGQTYLFFMDIEPAPEDEQEENGNVGDIPESALDEDEE